MYLNVSVIYYTKMWYNISNDFDNETIWLKLVGF